MHALTLRPDDTIQAAGGYAYFLLARYRSNGELDPTFGQGGIVAKPTAAVEVALEREALFIVRQPEPAHVEIDAWGCLTWADGHLPLSFRGRACAGHE